MNDDIYFVNEYFESIQGEGNYSGVNSFFLRFQYCNFTCSWCDSKFTWSNNSQNYESYTSSQLKQLIASHHAPHVILTGGEPSLYRLDSLVVPNKKFHVETNGSIIPTEALDITFAKGRITRAAMDETVISKFNWVVSPKLSNSNQALNEQSIKFWSQKEYCIFKFIAKDTNDLDEIQALIANFNIHLSKVYIGLEGHTLESQLKPELVDEIIKRGFNFSPRLHVLLWGDKRKK